MALYRHELLPLFVDLVVAVSQATAQTSEQWRRALISRVKNIGEILLAPEVDHSALSLHLTALDELFQLTPSEIATRAPTLEAYKIVLALEQRLRTMPIQSPSPKPQIPSPVAVIQSSPRPKPTVRTGAMNKNKEAIFSFIRRTQRARTKDIIDGFQTLSERTVKRNLKELVRSGLVQKRSEQKAVYYFALDLN